MSIEQARTCKKCQLENRHEDNFCTGCGADLGELSLPPLLISAGLTVAPFIIVPISSIFSVNEEDAYQSFGFAYIAVIVLCAVLLAGLRARSVDCQGVRASEIPCRRPRHAPRPLDRAGAGGSVLYRIPRSDIRENPTKHPGDSQ